MDRLNRLNRVVNEVAEERAQRFAGRDLEVGSAAPSWTSPGAAPVPLRPLLLLRLSLRSCSRECKLAAVSK